MEINGNPTGYSLRKRATRSLNEDALSIAKDWFGSDSEASESEGTRSVNKEKKRRPTNLESAAVSSGSEYSNSNSEVDDSNMGLPFPCTICDKRFAKNRYLKRHVNVVHVPKKREPKYPCPKCDKKFTNNTIQRHMKCMHNPQNPRPVPCQCTKCFLRFKDVKSLARHFCNLDAQTLTVKELPVIEIKVGPLDKQQKQRRSPSKRFNCKQCEKSFCRSDSLAGHMSVHTTETFNCSICDKSFKRKGTLYVHNARTHQEQYKQKRTSKRIQCKYCPKSFNDKPGYILHERRQHTGAKPFGCPICPKRFVDSTEVKYHVMFHTGERPYKCAVPGCNKSYTRSSHLLQHNRIHNGDRPYGCRVCTKTFRVSSHSIRHEKEVHKYFEPRPEPVVNARSKKNRTCRVCGKGFGSLFNRTLHEKNVHKYKEPVVVVETQIEPESNIKHETEAGHDQETVVMIASDVPKITQNSVQQEVVQVYNSTAKESQPAAKRVQQKNRNCRVCGKGFRSPSHCKRHEKNVHKYKEPVAETQAQPVSNTGDHQEKESVELITGDLPEIPQNSLQKEKEVVCLFKNEDTSAYSVQEMDIRNDVDTSSVLAVNIVIEPGVVEEAFKIEPIILNSSTTELDVREEIPVVSVYCPYCYIAARSDSELEEHARANHADRTSRESGSTPFTCPHLYCSKRLKSIKDLKIHQRNIHKLKDI